MGSRIMHAIIGNKMAEALSLEDSRLFLLGSIAPDAVFSHDEKNRSHFYTGDVHDYSRSVNYNAFIQKYSSQAESLYILGYFAHLIADDIWLKGFYLSWLRNRMEANEELQGLYHDDFRLLNGKLLEYYGMTTNLRQTFDTIPELIDLQEVPAIAVKDFVPYVLGDLEYDRKKLNEKLHVFTFDQIIGYMETAVHVGLLKNKAISFDGRIEVALYKNETNLFLITYLYIQ